MIFRELSDPGDVMINLVCYYVHIPGLMFLEWHPFRMRLADKSDLFLEFFCFRYR